MDKQSAQTIAQKSGSNFYLSFFSLPKEKREALTAVYAFCREVDDAVDDPGEKNPAAQVQRWKEEIARTFDGNPTLPLTQSLQEAVERFSLSRVYFDGILQGVEMDLMHQRYPTLESLLTYCYHVAGEVGLLCMEIFGYRSERLQEYAVKLGTAFQFTNILRDVKADAEKGRIYIPQEDLRRFNVEEEWLLQQASHAWDLGSERGECFRRLMKFEAARTREYYRQARVLPTQEEKPALRAAEIMRAIYEDILDQIQMRRYNVFGPRIRVATPRKLWLAARAWWECR